MVHELEKMCLNKEFDREKAEQLIQQIDVNQIFVAESHNYETVLLERASIWANVPMVELLLKNGADPNLVFNEEATLWDLQYNGDTDEESEDRLKIAQLLLEYGADPLIDPENLGESLFDYVLDMVFNDDFGELWKYRSRFFILLIAYGAKSEACTPRIVGSFDKAKMQQYEFYFVPEGNGRYSGVITDDYGGEIAYI